MNSLNPQLIFPMCAMFALTVVVFGVMFKNRIQAIKSGQLPITFFKNQTVGVRPDHVLNSDRHFVNLFEVPVLFYVVLILALILGIQSNVLVVLAWVFVIARIAHAFIHLGRNSLKTRPIAFGIGWMAVIIMWIIVFIHTLALVS